MNRTNAMRWGLYSGLLLIGTALGGCGILEELFRPRTVGVVLRNAGDYAIDVTLHYSARQDDPEDVLTTLGQKLEYTISPGDQVMFSRDCDNLQAIVIDDAKLRVLGGIGPTTHSNVLRDDTDFRCRDTIEFTFDHTSAITDFHVETSVMTPAQGMGVAQ